MSLKERGITVGDLLIFLIIIIAVTFTLKLFNKDNSSSILLIQKELIAFKR